jgi:hypothetical protein
MPSAAARGVAVARGRPAPVLAPIARHLRAPWLHETLRALMALAAAAGWGTVLLLLE